MIVKIYCTSARAGLLLNLFFISQNLRTELIEGIPELAKITGGRFTPANDAVAVTWTGAVIHNIFDAVQFIDDQGLRLL